MNYGLYLSAGGALSAMHQMDVVANNLANINTTGFKPDSVLLRDRLPERLENPAAWSDPQWMLEQLGGGHLVQPTRTDLSQGPITVSGNDLDLALQGEGFFVVDAGANKGLRLTRDGRFTLSPAGEMVMVTTGMKVMDINDRPITLQRNVPVQINQNGEVVQNDQIVAQLRIAAPPEPDELRKTGDNLFTTQPDVLSRRIRGDAMVLQHQIEESGVDPIMTLNKLISASKTVAANGKMMQYHDHIMGQAVNTLGRVA